MARPTTNKKSAPVTPEANAIDNEQVPLHIDRKKQIKLGIGAFLLFAGIFTCLSIISYCYSWSADMDKVFANKNLFFFIFSHTPVSNMGGDLGAVLGHVLVYKGAGIASLAIGMGIAAVGLNLLYDKKKIPALRYMRWLSIILLLAAPIFTYLFPSSPSSPSFLIGGALGDNTISYLNILLGETGTGMLLLGTVLFFVFVIFALDISPILKKLKKRAQDMASVFTPEPVFNEPVDIGTNNNADLESIEAEKKEERPSSIPLMNKLKKNVDNVPLVIEDKRNDKEWDMAIVEKHTPVGRTATEHYTLDNNNDDTDEDIADNKDEIELDDENFDEEEFADEIGEETDGDEPEFTFEVIQRQEKSAINHGSQAAMLNKEPYAPELDLSNYKFPVLDLLDDRAQETVSLDKEELEKNKNQIIQTLRSFGIEIQRIMATVGPTVTLYEIVPAEGVRISKIRNLEDDIALNLAALGIRIIAPIPGKGTIGIEVPNANKQIVGMRNLIASDKFVNNKMSLPIALGKKIDNENYIVDLAAMPHLLMAGATGQGKSVGINAILVSLLYKKHPSQLKFVMIDPKKVELSVYRTIEKHFLAKLPNEDEPIITDTKKVINTLNSLCIEMDNRYELLKEAGSRNIKEYNEKFISRKLNPQHGHKYLPFIVLVIDEFADLIMTAGKEVEMPIARLAQLARAIGIHLIIATQRPSVNVITGTIKANFPARIAFKVSAKVDSRTILDAGGAEQLIGRGDMLISYGSELLRLQCAFVDTPEVEKIVDFIGTQRGYPSAFELPEYEGADGDENTKEVDLTNRDKLFEDCARVVVQTQSGSTSMLQRRFNLGYNRAGRIMDQLEAADIVGPQQAGGKPREVYFKTEAELDSFLSELD